VLFHVVPLCFSQHDDSYTGPPIVSASAERLSRQGIYLMDNGKVSRCCGSHPNIKLMLLHVWNCPFFNHRQ